MKVMNTMNGKHIPPFRMEPGKVWACGSWWKEKDGTIHSPGLLGYSAHILDANGVHATTALSNRIFRTPQDVQNAWGMPMEFNKPALDVQGNETAEWKEWIGAKPITPWLISDVGNGE